MSDRRKIVAGNWKLNGSRASVEALAQAIVSGATSSDIDIVLCPTFVHLADVLQVVGNSSVHLGAQNCAEQASGAHTGEVAANMLAEFGVEYVIVGHSERRSQFSESSDAVASRVDAVLKESMTPILCVGETLEERDADQMEAVLEAQLAPVFGMVGVARVEDLVIAYEPVWAIGTGKTATPGQAQAAHAFIRRKVSEVSATAAQRVTILYGGSMKPDNAADLLACADIDGGLIGGAALDADAFLEICRACAKHRAGD